VNQKVNIVNLELRGAAYENRLTKYATRGFAVGVPGLDVSDLIDDAYFKVRKIFLTISCSLSMSSPPHLPAPVIKQSSIEASMTP